MVCATGNGIYASPARLKYFCRDLNRAQEEGRIIVTEIVFTGGGRAEGHEDFTRIAKYALEVCSNMTLLTAGAADSITGRRIEEFAALSTNPSSISISLNPEDPASYERVERTMRYKLSPYVMVAAKTSPLDGEAQRALYFQRMVNSLANAGCTFDRFFGINQEEITDLGLNVQTPNGSQVLWNRKDVTPYGRARQRLAHITKEVTPETDCFFTRPKDHVVIRSKADHTLIYCSDSQKPGEIPMTYDGIFHVIENRDVMAEKVKAAMAAAIGQKVHCACDVCPLA